MEIKKISLGYWANIYYIYGAIEGGFDWYWEAKKDGEVSIMRGNKNDTIQEKTTEDKTSKVYQRCKYVVEEMQRVQLAVQDLAKGDMQAFGKKMFETHKGLSSLYEVSCPELDFLVEAVSNNENVLGARMMGGGFGGCTINIIKKSAVEEIIKELTTNYAKKMHKELAVYITSIEDGTHIVEGTHLVA